LLLLDEPAAGLSLGELEEFGALMKEMRARGMTIVMVEHHIELVADIADSVTVLDQGQVLAEGTPEEAGRSAAGTSAHAGAAQAAAPRPHWRPANSRWAMGRSPSCSMCRCRWARARPSRCWARTAPANPRC